MDYLQSLLSLDGIAIANYDQVLQDGRRGGARPEFVRLLMALKAEAETAATLAVVSASIANALDRAESARPSVRCLRTFSPPELSLFSASATALIAEETAANLVPALQDFAARISFARQMSLAFVSDLSSGARSIDRETLCHAWRKACSSAQRAIEALNTELGQLTAVIAPEPPTHLVAHLEEAASGHAPCVEPDGCVIVPGWAERRRSRRVKVDLSAEVHLGSAVAKARVFDLSAGGMGLIGLNNSRRGDSVTVALESGRRFRGTIVWVTGEKAGVRFQQALSPDDALLCE